MIRPDGGATGEAPEQESDTTAPGAELAALVVRTEREWTSLEAELEEIRLLVQQARSEASRHEDRRAAAATRLDSMRRPGNEGEALEHSLQLVGLTRRATVMQTQVDVLEGKLKALVRYRDSIATITRALGGVGLSEGIGAVVDSRVTTRPDETADQGPTGAEAGTATLSPAVSRIVLAAQEELRREIARTMHDGPAQSLTNIVLQAQIVERLLRRDPNQAADGVTQLIGMVQQTLDATKSFIFDVRPMVLDDLGLVPTIRRAARERGRRAQTPVEFESFGDDRRLHMDLESGLFRILDEALAAFLEGRPEKVVIRLDWADGVEIRVRAVRPTRAAGTSSDAKGPAEAVAGRGSGGADAELEAGKLGGRLRRGTRQVLDEPATMHPQMAAMIESTQRATRRTGGLPTSSWREIQSRAATLGLNAELLDDGHELRLATPPEPPASESPGG